MVSHAGVDIIIPVYNAPDDLKLCYESIKAHTDLTKHRAIFVEDKSTDKTVLPYLRSIVQEPGVVLIENEVNQGFPGSVNRGVSYSDRDVILLNADTVVTKNWIEKLTACAYSDASIGTVTPFSNNATLCSIPNFCEDNDLPEGMTIDSYAEVVEKCSIRAYPRITTAVGFCMYIKREVIDCVGLLDKETFQRGYGEENDFCYRAEQLGYQHVLCDDTFIYHSGTMSFRSAEKEKLISRHEKILEQRYPRQVHENAVYVRDNPDQYLRDNIALYTKLANGRKNILYMLHSDFRIDAEDHVGGTQLHVKDLTMGLKSEYNVFVAARDSGFLRVTAYVDGETISLMYPIGPRPLFQQFSSVRYQKLLRNILLAFSINLVHVHQVKDVSFDIFHVAKELGLPLIVTLHDFYYICPSVTLLRNGDTYCGGECDKCAKCLDKQLGYSDKVDYMPVWRAQCRSALELCDTLILPSESAKSVYAKHYPQLESRMRVITHGMDKFDNSELSADNALTGGVEYWIESAFETDGVISGWALRQGCDSRLAETFLQVTDCEGKQGVYKALSGFRSDVADAKQNSAYTQSGFTAHLSDGWLATGNLTVRPLIRYGGKLYAGDATVVKGYRKRDKKRKRIAFIGGLNRAKGSQFAYNIIRRSTNRYDWYIFGGIGDKDLATLTQDNLFKTNAYQRELVTSILRENQIDLVCILPIWPETFCYTLSEAVLAGIPVLVTDIGAVGARVRKDGTGWIIPPDATPEDALAQIDRIFADQAAYERVARVAADFDHKTVSEMVAEYQTMYQTTIPEKRPEQTEEPDRELILSGCGVSVGSMVGGQAASGPKSDMLLHSRIFELESTLNQVMGSATYRLARRLGSIRIPFKKQIKRLMMRGKI